MNVYLHELRAYRTSTIIWTLSLSAIVVLFLGIFPSFREDVSASTKILSNLPLALREALGISLSNFFTLFGFYSYLFTFVSLAGSIQAMNLGLGVVAKEIANKTADFLLTKPIKRSSIITQKLLASLTLLFATNTVFIAAAFIAARSVDQNFDTLTFVMLSVALLFVQLVFLCLGILLATILAKVKSTIAVSLPVTFAFFIVSSLGATIGSSTVRYVTPFKFFDPNYIVQHRSYEGRFLVLELCIIVLSLLMAYVIFTRKDIEAA